jgi:GxxExxY protein
MESKYIHSDLTWKIVGSAIKVHHALGPGLLESTYRSCLMHELRLDAMEPEAEVPIPLYYKGLRLDTPYRADIVVGKTVLLELKATSELLPVHCTQVLTYLKLSRLPVALLINFNVTRLKSGIRRFVNTLEPEIRADR